MPYEVFEGRRGKEPSSEPTIRVNSDGVISLNRASMELLRYPHAVQILWDADARRVGLRATTMDDPNGFRVNRPENYACGQFHPRSFWTFIETYPVGVFDAQFDNEILSTEIPKK